MEIDPFNTVREYTPIKAIVCDTGTIRTTAFSPGISADKSGNVFPFISGIKDEKIG
jgi:hypothetical protein